ncbi:MAG: Hsp20/alpha crystallin family protein [Candidatus Onthomonas sp.]|nr:Hsp20/alpha crystallin family protein [Candidatus Onthomonas sp.]
MFGMTTFRPNQFLMDPFQEFEHMANSFFGANPNAGFSMDIKDNGTAYELKADLPGVEKEDIHIDLNGDAMTISAQRHSQYEEKDQQGNYVRCERSFGSFSRSFDVSGVDTDHVTAAYENGVLTLEMPKKGTTVPESRRLEIQ